MNTINKLAAVVVCGLVLTACGGGGNDTPDNTGSNGNTSTGPSDPGSSGNSSTGGSNTGTGSGNTGSGGTGNGSTGSGGTGSGSTGGGSTGSGSGTSDTQTSYTVTPSINGSGGAINPAAAVSVTSGASTSFQVTPNAGYTASVGGTCGGTLSGTTYTTNAVTANCTVVATFASKPLTFMYEGIQVAVDAAIFQTAADAASFLALLNQEGARGYRYLYDQYSQKVCTDNMSSACDSSYSPTISVFVNDGSAPSYTYDLLPNPANINDFITQANTEGAKGYQYMGLYGITPGAMTPPYALYRKDGGSTTTYTYATDTAGPMARDAFLNQANTHGQLGYWLYGRIGQNYTVPVNLYVKNNASNATYNYHAQTLLSLPSGVTDQINAEGANGYRLMFQLVPNSDILESDLSSMLYIKDQTQSASFIIQSVESWPSDGTALITQLNNYGAQGYTPWINSSLLYFFKTTNCSSGWFCTVFNPPGTSRW